MPFITDLDVINEMLASMGESPLNALDQDHPLVAAGIRMLNVANLREQAKSWWFNREQATLAPEPDTKFIYTPADAIRVDPTNSTLNYVQRGRRLYKAYAPASSSPFVFDAPVVCWLVRLVPFLDLPPSAQLLVSYAAQMDFQKAYDADQLKFQQITLEYRQALMQLNAEHTRNSEVNLFRRPSTAAVLNSLGRFRG